MTRHALDKRPARSALWTTGMFLLASGLAGCNSIDTPRAFQVKRWFKHEDPLVIVRDSTDGNRRAEALAALKEPVGYPEQSDVYIKVLTNAAMKDPEPLCRLRAITMLGKYRDPRAVQCLEEVCQQSPKFNSEMNSRIRQQALASLMESGDPAARRMLLVVARGADSPLESSLSDRQQTLDERFAAIRGLGKFKQYDAIETLVHILETERDAGLRDCAHNSLKEATGKSLPPDAVAWREMLRNPGDPAVAGREPGIIERVTGVLK